MVTINLTAFVCEYEGCNLIYENPITLPCGNSMCQQHLENYEKKFKCPFCTDEHQTPNMGFFTNKSMIKMINSHIQLDPLRKKISESFDNLNESIKQYNETCSDNYIDSYFYEIRNKVDLHREVLKKEIDDRSDEIMQKLKEKEEKCKLNAQKIEKINMDEFKNDYLPSFKQKFRVPNTNETELNDLLLKMNENIDRLEFFIKDLKKEFLLNESIEFEKYEKSSLFGELITKYDEFYVSKSNVIIGNYSQHTNTIRSIQFDKKSNKLISSSCDNTIKIWNYQTRECLKSIEVHTGSVESILIVSNNRFISASADKTIKVWDLDTYECLNTLTNESAVYSLCSLSNNQIACGCGDGSISIWNLNNSVKVKTFKAHDDRIHYLLQLGVKYLMSSSSDSNKKFKLWDLEIFECTKEDKGHSSVILYFDLTSDGLLLSFSSDKTLRLVKMDTNEPLRTIQLNHSVSCIKLLNDNLIAVGLHNGQIQIYDLLELWKIYE